VRSPSFHIYLLNKKHRLTSYQFKTSVLGTDPSKRAIDSHSHILGFFWLISLFWSSEFMEVRYKSAINRADYKRVIFLPAPLNCLPDIPALAGSLEKVRLND